MPPNQEDIRSEQPGRETTESNQIGHCFFSTLRLLRGKRGAPPEETDAYLTRLFRQMETAFPDALVTGWEPLAATLQLPDPDDRHVVAAAWAGRANVIVTDNLADFRSTPRPRRWSGSPWMTSCSIRSTFTTPRWSPQSALSPAGPENRDRP